jgi:hypothetical protein
MRTRVAVSDRFTAGLDIGQAAVDDGKIDPQEAEKALQDLERRVRNSRNGSVGGRSPARGLTAESLPLSWVVEVVFSFTFVSSTLARPQMAAPVSGHASQFGDLILRLAVKPPQAGAC